MMLSLTEILASEPVVDPEEEAFIIFSQAIPSQSLGFIDSQAATLELSVAGHDLVIHQSRGLLTSDRKAGTTGAVWKITPLFSTWISSPQNFLFTTSLLHPSSTILELGAGVSGIVALSLAPKVSRYTATDQAYVLKLLRQNIAENADTVFPQARKQAKGAKATKAKESGSGSKKSGNGNTAADRILIRELDWETDSVTALPAVDLLIACDCIYNEALIEPLNTTCAALCKLRNRNQENGGGTTPTLCLIAQQLRSPEVFEAWLRSFHEKFWVWRVPDGLLDEGLGEGSGFVVHVGVVR
ncbi:diaminohydroxyphosphoribosylamino-pyrimidine deaminase [Pyrenophora seminiperda CCB06]|uniref:Diaminohydroxyphosphoribosylamino-pyrimidine deaminase n=1 Tax=Pyrenophora seminiperda CCB06 TaxID=1302712 RepID=A0A3M7MFZ9_9PLEO|nr:diaminohydroxyphosphoribosylamino-pyrimidine deaminase [Pyrenophora seminiperda CCB06]